MSIWQGILIGGWLLALTVGRADWRVAGVMACNFAISAVAPVSIGLVGIADLATAVVLAALGPRAMFIAALYCLCAVLNAAGHIFQWQPQTTYAIMDPIGWLMLAVLGHGDSGIRRVSRALRGLGRRGRVPAYLAGKGRDVAVSVAMVSGADK